MNANEAMIELVEREHLAPSSTRARQIAAAPIPLRVPTGLATLDRLLRSGIPEGRRVVFAGAPGAAKTTLALQLYHAWARRGASVVYIAADQNADDALARLGCREGLSRDDLEGVSGVEPYRCSWNALADRLADLPNLIMLDGEEATIEQAAARLRDLPRPHALFIDSLQTVRCFDSLGAASKREEIDLIGAAIRKVAHSGAIVVATSEVARSVYRSTDPAQQTSALAGAKESGSIEYAADILIGLRSVRGEPDLVDAELAKNRLGPREDWRMRLNRHRAELVEVDAPPATDSTAQRDEQRSADAHAKHRRAAIAIVRLVSKTPGGLALRDLEGAVRAELRSVSRAVVDAARHMLGASLVRSGGPTNGSGLYIDGAKLPGWVLAELPADERAVAGTARPPLGDA